MHYQEVADFYLNPAERYLKNMLKDINFILKVSFIFRGQGQNIDSTKNERILETENHFENAPKAIIIKKTFKADGCFRAFKNNFAINKMQTWNLQEDILILAAGHLYFYG